MASGLTGIFSNINTDALVQAEMAVESGYQNQLKTQQTQVQQQQAAFNDIKSAFSGLDSALTMLRGGAAKLAANTASSSNTSVVNATGGAGTPEGSHQLVVHQLATSQRRIQTTGLASASQVVGSSKSTAANTNTAADADATWITTGDSGATYTLQFGAETAITGITLAANTTYSLNQVAALINQQSQSLAGYNAASVTSVNGQFQLNLTSNSNGPVGTAALTLTSGTAVDQLGDAGWTKTNGGTGAFVYTYGGKTRTITTSSTTTLQSLADSINNDSGNPGVSASVLQYNNSYHLVLAGRDTGADHTITIESATTLVGFGNADIAQTQAAANAQIQLDGFPSSGYIERDSNTISDVITGATLNLQSASDTPVTVTFTRDTTALKQNISNLVSQYNSLVTKVQSYTGYDATKKTAGVLQGDITIETLMDQARSALTNVATGFESASDGLRLSADLGISVDKTGQMAFDQTQFDTAVNKDYQGVLSLISAANTGTTDSTQVQFNSALSGTKPGTYSLQVQQTNGVITSAKIQVAGESVWRDMKINGNTLTGQSGGPEAGVSLTVATGGSSPINTTVHIQQGFVEQAFSDLDTALNDTTNGAFAIKSTEYSDRLQHLQDEIDAQQKMLDAKQTALKAKYAQLEATLAQIQQQGAAVSALNQFTTGINNSNSSGTTSSSSSSSGGSGTASGG